jgi:hypothetical protein
MNDTRTPEQRLADARKDHVNACRHARRIAEERNYRRSVRLDNEYAKAVERASRTLAAIERLEAEQPAPEL